MKKISILIAALATSLLLKTGCSSDFMDTVPSNAASIVTLTEDFDRAKTIMVGTNRARFRFGFSLGGSTIQQFDFGEHSTLFVLEYLADDFFATGLSYGPHWIQNPQLHNTSPATVLVAQPWFFMYRMIDNVNQVINRVDDIPGLTPAQKGFLLGNGLVYRAHYHHMLVQIYAQAVHHSPNNPGVVINTGLGGEALPRSTVREVYDQIIQDLNDALVALETAGVMDGSNAITPRDGTRHNIAFASPAVVRGLLSRVYLDLHDFQRAATYARAARVGVPLMTRAQFRDGFLTRNAEWMWGSIVPSDEAQNFATFPAEMTNGTEFGTFYPAAWGFDNAISRQLVDAAHPDDARFGDLLRPHRLGFGSDADVNLRYDKYRWTGGLGSAFDLVYMRGAEMLLNEAEALAMIGGQEAAVRALLTELLTARVNATYAAKVNAMNNAQLLAEVKMQRRKEFWGEGRRFFDLKRRGEALDRRHAITGSGQNAGNMRTVQVDDPRSGYWVYLIPTRELTNNPYMTQNNYPQ